jgi:hypothetical protein
MRARIRVAVDAMMSSGGDSRAALIDVMLDEAFDWLDHRADSLPEAFAAQVEEHGQLVRADLAFEVLADDDGDSEQAPYRMLGIVTPWGTHPLSRTTTGSWTASAAERLAVLLRVRNVPLGLVTDGR